MFSSLTTVIKKTHKVVLTVFFAALTSDCGAAEGVWNGWSRKPHLVPPQKKKEKVFSSASDF